MSKFFDLFKGLFDGGKNRQNKVPFLHESIDLNSFPVDEVEIWKSEGGYNLFADLLRSTYRNILITGQQQPSSKSVSILDSSYSNGWFLHCNQLDFTDLNYKFFAYELSSKLKGNGYVIQLAELKSTSKSEGVEMITRYYLKPSLKNRFVNKGELANQLFGNISIEYKVINGNPESFKFLAKAYQDSKFSPPQDFNDLHAILFDQ